MFYFCAGTSPQRYEEVIAELTLEITRVQDGGVTAAELLRCQTRLKAGRTMNLQTNGARAMQGALNAIYGQPVNDARDYPMRIDAVTREDLKIFARKYLRSNQRTQLVVKP